MNRLGRAALWVLINGGFLALVITATVYADPMARNLVLFFAWVMLAMNTLGVNGVQDETVAEKLKAKGRSVPRWMSSTVDAVIVVMLAAHGWFVIATVIALAWLFESAIWHKVDAESPVARTEGESDG